MRYTDDVTFVKKNGVHYDPELGEEVSELIEKNKLAKVTYPNIEQSQLAFGNMKSTNIIVIMKQACLASFDYVVFKDSKYSFVTERTVDRHQAFYMKGDGASGIDSNRDG